MGERGFLRDSQSHNLELKPLRNSIGKRKNRVSKNVQTRTVLVQNEIHKLLEEVAI